MNESDKKKARDLAVIAQAVGSSFEDANEALEMILEGIRKIPEQMQMMVDQVVNMQREFPMSEDGWKAFVESIEYTNEKHGLNLRIKPELLEDRS